MVTFTAGPNGANILSLLSLGSTVRTSVTDNEADVFLSSGQKSAFYGSFSVNPGGTTASAGTITGWSIFGANGQLNFSITGLNADLASIATNLNHGSVSLQILPPGTTYYGSSNPAASDILIGNGGGDTFIGGAASETFEPSGGDNTIRGGTGANTVQFGGAFNAYGFVNGGGGLVSVIDSVPSRNGVDHISGVQTLKFTDAAVTVGSDGTLHLPTTNAAQAVTWSGNGDLAPINISDSSTNVVRLLPSLEIMSNAGKLGTIALTDTGTVTLALTAAQVNSAPGALQHISTPVVLNVSGSTPNIQFTAPPNAPTTVVLPGASSHYHITANGTGGVSVDGTVNGQTSSDYFVGVTALSFADQTDFLAKAPSSSGPTSGNITELYAAAFGRQPDVAGLGYYEAKLSANPSTPLTSFAQSFLNSPEYTNNPAHHYAQSTAGDTQFITDLYTNILHRAPESGAVPYYLGLIGQLTQGTSPGSSAYSNALAMAHAVVLTDVSQSAEFVGNVQVTATSSGAGHWLILG